jgi:NAD(P)H-hydrate epimerase
MPGMVPKLPQRPAEGHKGTFGTVCVLGGQAAGATPRVMIGAPALTATAALRSGCGLAVLAMPAPILPHALAIAPSATGLALPVDGAVALRPSAVAALLDQYLHSFHALAIGPGLGAEPPQQQVVLRLVTQDAVPMVIDADAINALAATPDVARDLRAPAILTPHPAEFRRLAARVSVDGDPVDAASRPEATAALARRLGCVVVLKGPGTVVSSGIETWTATTGNVALATAGTGDVLTGVIAGLIAQFGRAPFNLSLFECARLGVHLHGLAADRWAAAHGPAGLLASELAGEIPGAMQVMRRGGA